MTKRLIASLALALGLMVAPAARATGSWGSITDSQDTGAPGNGTGTGSGEGYNWAITGNNGSFSGSAHAWDNWFWTKHTHDTGLHTATGWKQKTQGAWNRGPDPACPCAHEAPGNATVTGQGDGNVQCDINVDANNGDIDSGSTAAVAYAEITFSGVAPGTCKVDLNTTFSEGDTTISGTLSADPSITITTTVGSDTASASGVNTVSVTNPFTGNIAGKLQKGYGCVSVKARINNGAYDATSSASTNISTLTLTKDYGGSYKCPSEETAHEGH